MVSQAHACVGRNFIVVQTLGPGWRRVRADEGKHGMQTDSAAAAHNLCLSHVRMHV